MLRKILILFLSTFVCSMVTYATEEDNSSLFNDGVSRTLAIKRASKISNIMYHLAFNVPESQSVPVLGDVKIEFDYINSEDLIIDFQQSDSTNVYDVIVNGVPQKLHLANEHFIVPQAYLLNGRNTIEINHFVASDKTLNRHGDYLYTLLVPDRARTLFPCFDQPDLKARFLLTLSIPKDWKAISNAPIKESKLMNAHQNKPKVKPLMQKIISFQTSDLLPTYLFSFTAGDFIYVSDTVDGYAIEGLYRKQSEEKENQVPIIFQQISLSLRWLEQYTGIKQPFQKYGFVVLPGYQFGGMEHPGAIQLNEKRIFLRDNPSMDEQLSRLNLIAHETSHLWFGDYVTMKWFDDVWTKEVFANFFADKISREQFPHINHQLSFIRSHYPYSLSTDRTSGSHPIQQPLENLNQAGLLYGNIVYHKAPIMMQKLEDLMGEDTLRLGLQQYLREFSFSNATWDNLISCFNSVNPAAQVTDFSRVWVKESGLPTITYSDKIVENDSLKNNSFIQATYIRETNLTNEELHWQQLFDWGQCRKTESEGEKFEYGIKTIDFRLSKSFSIFNSLATRDDFFYNVPNISGNGYGRFLLSSVDAMFLLDNWYKLDETPRLSSIITLYENYLANIVSAQQLFLSLLNGLNLETNQLISFLCINYMSSVLPHLTSIERDDAEQELLHCSQKHTDSSVRLQLKRLLSVSFQTPNFIPFFYDIWKEQSAEGFTERDYVELSYHLCQVLPDKYDEICFEQRTKITSIDLLNEFDFVVRACSPDTLVQMNVFSDLLKVENRRTEPWAAAVLRLLNSASREPFSNRFLQPGLDVIEEIQRTGDIFFPTNWLRALLSGHHSVEAKCIVEQWITNHPNLNPFLINKIKENSHHLLTMH